ncbi:MAG: cobalamin biosynthesis protein CobD [Deltaproteobacteria bacterium]|nr:cobalamin biosynthesis protein CobD [Deltaproteobacteria bacterium]
MDQALVLISMGFVLDFIIGDPQYPFHPVRLIGHGIARLEGFLRARGLDGRGGGALLAGTMFLISLLAYLLLDGVFRLVHPWAGFLFNLYLCTSLLALGDLLGQVGGVEKALAAGDLDTGRKRLAMLVGRELRDLDEEGLNRAAVETTAENFVDGLFSPLFWFFCGMGLSLLPGLAGVRIPMILLLAFKVASTLDSMVGYRNAAYRDFGQAGARSDDVMNFVPARISLFFLFLGALFLGLRSLQGVKIALRDRLKHDSPNAAHAESFVAGALGIRLGGPTRYPEGLKDKPWLGDGDVRVQVGHIRQTALLVRLSAWISLVTGLALFIAI